MIVAFAGPAQYTSCCRWYSKHRLESRPEISETVLVFLIRLADLIEDGQRIFVYFQESLPFLPRLKPAIQSCEDGYEDRQNEKNWLSDARR